MFKLRKFYNHRNVHFNTVIESIKIFPNGNLLLLGKKVQIYDPNFNLIYLYVISGFSCFDSCIISNDLFLALRIPELILFYKNNCSSNDENTKLINISYNFKVIPICGLQFLFHKCNNLICRPFSDLGDQIIIYDFDKNKDYNCFIKTVLKEKTESNLLLMDNTLIFYVNATLKLYNLKLLNKPPEKMNLMNLSKNSDDVRIKKFDKDNIIIYNKDYIIKYDFKFKEIKLKINNDYYFLTITQNYILAFNYGKHCKLLNKNFDLIQPLGDYSTKDYIGEELLNGEIVLVHYGYTFSKIHTYKKNLMKCVVFTSIRYLIIIFLSSLVLRYFIYNLNKFNFKKFYDYIYFGLIIWIIIIIKRLIFNHMDF